jgi:hypothetical protein
MKPAPAGVGRWWAFRAGYVKRAHRVMTSVTRAGVAAPKITVTRPNPDQTTMHPGVTGSFHGRAERDDGAALDGGPAAPSQGRAG